MGICEVVHEYGGCVDLHDLAREFGYLRLMLLAIEGARTLGLIKMRNGEISLSHLGQGPARQNIDARFRRRCSVDILDPRELGQLRSPVSLRRGLQHARPSVSRVDAS
jgi:hypothetical protein